MDEDLRNEVDSLKSEVEQLRADGWLNLIAGLGGSRDKSIQTTTANYRILDDLVLSDLWMGDGFGKRIVSVVADDMTRKWITVPGDTNNKIITELHRLKAKSVFNTALKWMRLFGGGLIVVGYRDQGKLEDPFKGNSKGIDFLRAYSKADVVELDSSMETDPSKSNFGEPAFFTIQPRIGNSFKVHSSRTLVFKGELVPKKASTQNYMDYWGMSVLQSIWDQLSNLGGAQQGVSHILLEFIVGKYTLANLAQLLAQKQEAQIVQRMEIINMSKSVINAVLLGEGEKYERDTANLSGLSDVLDRLMMFLSGVSEIPVTRLFGRSPAGMNATGESDLTNYYDMVSSQQENRLQDPLQMLIYEIAKYVNVPPASAGLVFNPLRQPTQTEILAMRKTQAEIDKMYLDSGVLGPEDIYNSRFANGYSFETEVEGVVK